jgi:hypothetical protein
MSDEPRRPKQENNERYVRCEKCGARIDNLNVRQMLDHEGPLPHPKEEADH